MLDIAIKLDIKKDTFFINITTASTVDILVWIMLLMSEQKFKPALVKIS
jgi:hypothetical protein